MSFLRCAVHGYWPYEESDLIIQIDNVTTYDEDITTADGKTHYCNKVERSTDPFQVAVLHIYYICDPTPHTHTGLQTYCSRYVKCFQRVARRRG